MKATKFFIYSLLIATLLPCLAFAEENFKVGIVNFTTCIEKSYLGQEESKKLEDLRSEMISMLEAKQKDFQEVAEKLNNPDYMDALAPDAEAELQTKAQNLSQELQYLGQQSDQAIQQAQMKMLQNVKAEIDNAAAYIAREKNLDFIINKDSCFYFKRPCEITQLVINELNRHFQPSEETDKAKDK